MPSDAHIEATGFVQKGWPRMSDGNQPSKVRISVYLSGSKDKDNIRRWFVTVKSFKPEDVQDLEEGDKIQVVGRPDVWQTKEDVTVVDIVADNGGITKVDRDGNPVQKAKAAARQPEIPDYDEEPW